MTLDDFYILTEGLPGGTRICIPFYEDVLVAACNEDSEILELPNEDKVIMLVPCTCHINLTLNYNADKSENPN